MQRYFMPWIIIMPSHAAITLLTISLLAILGMLFVAPIPQDPAYHLFVDVRQWWSIPNTLDVLSNVPFILTGLLGLKRCLKCRETLLFWPFLAMFIGVFWTAFGSAYYHWAPGNETLVWDRLPMTIAFMGLFTLVLADRVDSRWRYALLPLLIAGIASVWYWDWTEDFGAGDLRPYALVQFLPMLLIPLILILYPAPRRDYGVFIGLLFFYVLAKLLEHFDRQVFELTSQLVSGHSLKHLSAALATAFLYVLLIRHTHNYSQQE